MSLKMKVQITRGTNDEDILAFGSYTEGDKFKLCPHNTSICLPSVRFPMVKGMVKLLYTRAIPHLLGVVSAEGDDYCQRHYLSFQGHLLTCSVETLTLYHIINYIYIPPRSMLG